METEYLLQGCQDWEDSGFGAAMMCSITEEPLASCRLKGPPKLFTQGWNVSLI